MLAQLTWRTTTSPVWCFVNGALRARIVHGSTGTHPHDLHDPKRLTQVAHCLKDFLVPLQRFPQLTQCQGMITPDREKNNTPL